MGAGLVHVGVYVDHSFALIVFVERVVGVHILHGACQEGIGLRAVEGRVGFVVAIVSPVAIDREIGVVVFEEQSRVITVERKRVERTDGLAVESCEDEYFRPMNGKERFVVSVVLLLGKEHAFACITHGRVELVDVIFAVEVVDDLEESRLVFLVVQLLLQESDVSLFLLYVLRAMQDGLVELTE